MMKAKRISSRKHLTSRLGKKTKRKAQSDETSKQLQVLTVAAPEIAAAILGRQKRVENRPWPLRDAMLGKWIALHVGTGKTTGIPRLRRYVVNAWDREAARRLTSSTSPCYPYRTWDPSDKCSPVLPPTSAIVAFIRFSGQHKLARGEKRDNPWALGPWVWELDRVVPLDRPILNVKGNLGFWYASGGVKKQGRGLKPQPCKQLRDALEDVRSRKGVGNYRE
jgi:hypothetical protein